jgi:integrase
LLPVLRKAKPKRRKTITEKNARLLRELEDPVRRAKILHLPRHLMRLAPRLRDGWVEVDGTEHTARPLEGARMAALAAAIEVELHMPMRLENLSRLRLGVHLQKLDSQRRTYTHVAVPAEDTKTQVPFEWPLERDSAALLEEFVRAFRPLLPHAASDWLFPSKVGEDRPRAKGGLRCAILKGIHSHVGVRMTPHQFRALAGAFILEDNPHAIEDLRLILGHSTLEMSLRYYAAWAPKDAAARLGRLISTKRRETKWIADAAFAKRRRSSGPPKTGKKTRTPKGRA